MHKRTLAPKLVAGALVLSLSMTALPFIPSVQTVSAATVSYTAENAFDFDAASGCITAYKGADQIVNVPETIGGVTVTGIEWGAFSESAVTQVTLPNTINTIGSMAFEKCTNLTSINIPDNIKILAPYTFYGCTSLTELTLPSASTEIMLEAFSGCINLRKITIPASVTTIDTDAFYNCNNLTIAGEKGSYTQTFANSAGITFEEVVVDNNTPSDPDNGNNNNDPSDPDNGDSNNKPSDPDNGDSNNKPSDPDNGNNNNHPSDPDNGDSNNKPSNPDNGNDNNIPSDPDNGDSNNKPSDPDNGDSNNKPSDPDNGNGNSNNKPSDPDNGNSNNKPSNPDNGNSNNKPSNPDNGNNNNKPSNPDNGNSNNKPSNPDNGNSNNTPTNPDNGNNNTPPSPDAGTESPITEVVEGSSTLTQVSDLITSNQNENDVKGATYAKLCLRVSKSTNSSQKLKWNKVNGASGYVVFASKCGEPLKLVKTITSGKTTTFTNNKLKKGTYYKYVVAAYKQTDGKQITLTTAKTIHVPTKGGKFCDIKSVKTNKSKVTLKKGKTFKIKASEVKDSTKKKLSCHKKLAFESSNTKIATVSKTGKVKAKSKGSCNIYVYAQNGVFKKVKVTVK